MSDHINISYSLQSDTHVSPGPASGQNVSGRDDALYAAADCERVNLPGGGVLLIHRQCNNQLIVAPEVAIALNSCHNYRTLQGHVDVLTATIPQLAGQQEDVTKVLRMVRDAGLMTTARSVCERLCPPDTPQATDLPPTRAFIITCDRPTAVQRLLESMLHAGNLTQHERLFLVDDSRDPQHAAQNRDAVARFNLTSPRDMHYVGAEEQRRLMNALIVELPDHEAGIRFLIDRQRWSDVKSYGLSRTLCLLLSVDCRAIVMDDDVICAAIKSPHKRDGLLFNDSHREVDFYRSQQDILARTARADFDPLTGHAQCLGLTMAQAINKLGFQQREGHHLRNANAMYMNQWSADSPVLITQSGTLGDPGTVGTDWIYTIDRASSQRLLASPGGLETALQNRHYWLGQPRPVFSKMAVISQMTGLDNAHLLPPYFPAFRGEDYLFGAMVEFLHPDGVILDYDWSVPHFTMETRAGSVTTTHYGSKSRLNPGKYITDRTLYNPGVSAKTRLARLAVLSRELAESSDQSLHTLFRTETAELQGSQLKRLNKLLQDGTPRPQAWQDYLEQSIAAINQALQSVARVGDLPGVSDYPNEQEALATFRRYAAGFALGLEAWTAVRKIAPGITAEMLSAGDLSP